MKKRCRIESIGISMGHGKLFKLGSIAHAVKAGKQCLKSSIYSTKDINILINTGVYRDQHIMEPSIASLIQNKLNMNIDFHSDHTTFSFDLLNGSCGMLNAIELITSQMACNTIQRGMVVSSEANRDRHSSSKFPYLPSGVAVLLDIASFDRIGFGNFVFHSHDQHAKLYQTAIDYIKKNGELIFEISNEIENYFLRYTNATVNEVLEKNNLTREEIDFVVPQQISADFLQRLPTVINISKDKIVNFSSELPNTLSTSTFLALYYFMQKHQPAAGNNILLLSFGSGITIAGTIYQV